MPRKRTIPMQFFVDKEEKEQIENRMKKTKMPTLSAYLRQMAVDGFIVNVDTTDLKNFTQAINRIGVNINQIVKRANESNLYDADVESVKESLEKVWQLQRYILSKQL